MNTPKPAVGIMRWRAAFLLQPMLVAISSIAVPLGMATIILGERASRAFTVLGGDVPAKMVGLAMFTCGLLTLIGIFSDNTFIQAVGGACGVVGFALYGGGCYLGLGVNGIIAGSFAGSVAIGYLGRILLLVNSASAALAPPPK